MTTVKMRELLIIGSGPAGLSASIYAKRSNIDVLVVEKEFEGTGQIAESARVDNYIGLVGKSGYEIGEVFRRDAESFGVEFYEAKAVKIIQKNGRWLTEFDNGEMIESQAVIYAAGASHKKLHSPGEDRFIGKGVSFCALCDGALYQDKTVAVIGGGDAALDDALYLADIADKVYLIHRRNEFRGSSRTVQEIHAQANIETVLSANVTRISGNGHVEAIKLDNGDTIAVDGVFVAVGMLPQTDLLKEIVAIDEYGYITADESGITKAKGLFAAGDVRTKRLRQVVTAVSDGANAAMSAVEYLKKVRLTGEFRTANDDFPE